MKTYIWIGVIVVVAFGIGLGVWFTSVVPTQKKLVEIEKESSLCDSISNEKSASITGLEKSLADEKSAVAGLKSKNNVLSAQIETLEPMIAKADSLATANAELQAQVATLAVSKGKGGTAGKKTTATTPATTVAKVAKGKPVIDDGAKTFTYLASDSALVSTLAPSGYTLVKKPR